MYALGTVDGNFSYNNVDGSFSHSLIRERQIDANVADQCKASYVRDATWASRTVRRLCGSSATDWYLLTVGLSYLGAHFKLPRGTLGRVPRFATLSVSAFHI